MASARCRLVNDAEEKSRPGRWQVTCSWGKWVSHDQRKQHDQGGADWSLGLINAHRMLTMCGLWSGWLTFSDLKDSVNISVVRVEWLGLDGPAWLTCELVCTCRALKQWLQHWNSHQHLQGRSTEFWTLYIGVLYGTAIHYVIFEGPPHTRALTPLNVCTVVMLFFKNLFERYYALCCMCTENFHLWYLQEVPNNIMHIY